MKKVVLFLFLIIILSSCTDRNFKDITPTVQGVNIDSAQWEPVHIQVNENHILILQDNQIRKLYTLDSIRLALIVLLIGFILGFIIAVNLDN